MNTLLRKSVIMSGAALAALALGMSSASAATTFTVKAGSAANGTTVAITGKTTGASPQIAFVDTTSGTKLNCASGTAAGSTKVGSGRAGAAIGTINGATSQFNTCTGPLGLVLNVTGIGTWNINALGGGASGVNGKIGAIKATVSTSDGTTCKFSVAGSIDAKFVNSNSTLVLPGLVSGLKVSSVTGCFGLVNNGDVAKFKAVYKLTATNAAFNPIKITKD